MLTGSAACLRGHLRSYPPVHLEFVPVKVFPVTQYMDGRGAIAYGSDAMLLARCLSEAVRSPDGIFHVVWRTESAPIERYVLSMF